MGLTTSGRARQGKQGPSFYNRSDRNLPCSEPARLWKHKVPPDAKQKAFPSIKGKAGQDRGGRGPVPPGATQPARGGRCPSPKPTPTEESGPSANPQSVPQPSLALHDLPRATPPASVRRERPAGTSTTLTQALQTQKLKHDILSQGQRTHQSSGQQEDERHHP